jgi:trehalose 2-sulfotransferase
VREWYEPSPAFDGIDTGYEAKFDFPSNQHRPQVAYLLASVPRAGSTYCSHVLWRTGCLGAPLEYLNFDPTGPYSFAANSAETQQKLWQSILRRRTSPNGVFGLKAFQMQLQDLDRTNKLLLHAVLSLMLPRDRPRKIVYLRRRDRIAQTVSYARASMTGIWRKEQEPAKEPQLEYSEEALDAAERGIGLQEGLWEQMFLDLKIEPLRIWHEDVLAGSGDITRQVADYLGVTIEPAAVVQIPQIMKQSEGAAPEWIARYSKSKGLM